MSSNQYVAGSSMPVSTGNLSLLTSIIQKYPIVGIDISKWNGRWDGQTAVAQGASFVIIRAGYTTYDQGAMIQDDTFVDNWREAEIAKIPAGAYWYFVPAFDPIEQAKSFVDIVKLAGGRATMGLFGDFENNSAKLPIYKVQQSVKLFLETVDRLWGGGKRCGIYTRASFWNPNVGSIPGIATGRVRWLAQYNTTVPIPPNGFAGWDIWQCSADGNGLGNKFGCASNSVDINVFSWTAEKFKQVYGVEPNQFAGFSKPTVPIVTPDWVSIKTPTALRSTPAVVGKIKGQAAFGSTWKVLEEQNGWYKLAEETFVTATACQTTVHN